MQIEAWQHFWVLLMRTLWHQKNADLCTNTLNVTGPVLRDPDEGTLGAEKHLEAHFDKLLEGGGIKITPLMGFKLLSHPHPHLGVLQASAH
jgi:hypothetical protein